MVYDFGERMRTLRTRLGLSQTQVAQRLGLTRASISSYENNIAKPSTDVLLGLADLYRTTPDYLLGVGKRTIVMSDDLSEQQVETIKEIVGRVEKQFLLDKQQMEFARRK